MKQPFIGISRAGDYPLRVRGCCEVDLWDTTRTSAVGDDRNVSSE